MTILYVDDDNDDREIFGEALRQLNQQIVYHQASHGKEALDRLNQPDKLPDYIFSDVLMPFMSGGELIKEIKKDPRLKKIPLVLCTTYLTPQATIEFKELGVTDILFKSHSMDELVKSLSKILK